MRLIAVFLSVWATSNSFAGAPASPRGRAREVGRLRVPIREAQFEFAPANGAMMGAVCACTAPTGTRGEALTFSRASSAMCTKGTGITGGGINNGDLVLCSANQPRVMPGNEAVAALGLAIENNHTNDLLRSQELDNGAWTSATTGICPAPVVTPDFAVAPDGTTTAERVQIQCDGGVNSYLKQTGFGSASRSASIYAKGNGDGGTIHILQISGGSPTCTACTYNGDTWTRCSKSNQATSTGFGVGVANSVGGGCTAMTDPVDVLLWGAMLEAHPNVHSYVPTTSGTATQTVEYASFQGLSLGLTGELGSFSCSANSIYSGWLNTSSVTHTYCALSTAAPAWSYLIQQISGSVVDRLYMNGVTTVSGAYSPTARRPNAKSAYWNTKDSVYLWNKFLTSGSTTGIPTSPVTVEIGNFNGGTANPADAVISRMCVDPDPDRCLITSY